MPLFCLQTSTTAASHGRQMEALNLIPTINSSNSHRALFSFKMVILRLLVAVVFHLPVVFSFPYAPAHLGLRSGGLGLSTDPPPLPLPLPTATAPSIPTLLPPPSTTTTTTTITTLAPTPTGDPWKDMCKPGAECDCSRIQDKNGEE